MDNSRERKIQCDPRFGHLQLIEQLHTRRQRDIQLVTDGSQI